MNPDAAALVHVSFGEGFNVGNTGREENTAMTALFLGTYPLARELLIEKS
jgi:hypothetical protein